MFLPKKTADTSPFSSQCGRIPTTFYNDKQAMFIYFRQNEDYVPSSPCSAFPWVSGRVQSFHFNSVCGCFCVCVCNVFWGKDFSPVVDWMGKGFFLSSSIGNKTLIIIIMTIYLIMFVSSVLVEVNLWIKNISLLKFHRGKRK